MEWDELLVSWERYMKVMNYSGGTAKIRLYWMRRFARAHPQGPAAVTFDDLVAWSSSHDWKATTRHVAHSSLRTFYRWAVEQEHLPASPASRLPRVKLARPKPRPAPEADFHFALAIADRRVRLALMLAGYCGLRRFEIAKARREDMEADLAGFALRVVGKGGHVRIVPLPDEVVVEIKQVDGGWLFPSTRKQDGDRPISADWLGKLVARELPRDLTTHQLRHRCGTVAYASTKDLRAVQELLGHSKPEITAMYTEVNNLDVRKAMQAAVA